MSLCHVPHTRDYPSGRDRVAAPMTTAVAAWLEPRQDDPRVWDLTVEDGHDKTMHVGDQPPRSGRPRAQCRGVLPLVSEPWHVRARRRRDPADPVGRGVRHLSEDTCLALAREPLPVRLALAKHVSLSERVVQMLLDYSERSLTTALCLSVDSGTTYKQQRLRRDANEIPETGAVDK